MAMATSGSPAMALAYHSELKPSASACTACSTIRSTLAAAPDNPILMPGS